MKKGINAWIFPRDFSTDKVLETAREIGYEGVELNFNEQKLELDRKGRLTILEKAKSLGLELPSLCTGMLWKYNLASPDAKVREKGIEIVKKSCEFAADLGAKVLLVVPAVAVPEIPYEKTWELSRESVLETASTAEDFDVYLGIENVWNRFLYSPLEFRRFIEGIGHPHVKAYFDVGNVHFLGFPHQWIRHLAELIVCVHVKGFHRPTMQFRPLLQGDIDWAEVMKALRSIGYDGFLNVEVSPYPVHPTKSALDNKTALDIILES